MESNPQIYSLNIKEYENNIMEHIRYAFNYSFDFL